MKPIKFTKNILGKNSASKIICFLCAVVLWFSMATKAEYSYKVNIPILYDAPSSGFILASNPPENIPVYLRGTGKDLLLFLFKRLSNTGEHFISAPLAGFQKGRHLINLDKNDISLSMDSGIVIENILNNASFSVVIDKRIKRTVKINMDELPDYKLEDNFVLTGKPVAKPENVTVEGPEDIVNTITSVKVAALATPVITLMDSLVHATLETNISFVDVTPSEADIYFPIEPLRTKLFRGIPVTMRNFPVSIRETVNPDTLSVVVQGPETLVSKLRAEDVLLTVDYSLYREQIALGDSLLIPTIICPEGITGIRTTPGVLRINSISSGG